MITKKEIQDHIHELSAQLETTVVVNPLLATIGSNGRSHNRRRLVELARSPDTEEMYAVALHEFGHVAHNHQNSLWDDGISTAKREQQAWQWAKNQAHVWTDRMEAQAQKSYGTYMVGAPADIARQLPLWKGEEV